MKKVRVGINGLGRIGRILFRTGWENLDIVAINGLMDVDLMAHLLKWDSTHGPFPEEVRAEKDKLCVGSQKIPVTKCKDPASIPWKDYGVDIVLECTGVFKTKEDFEKHLKAGAQKVMVSAPAPGVDKTIVYGINHEEYDPSKHHFISNASCTTNCLTPLAYVLDQNFQIETGFMTTVHSYTNDQSLLDKNHKDFRRTRAAGVSMIPTSTGAAKSVGEVLPDLDGKIDGIAIRVPTANVSLVDFVFKTKEPLSVSSINTSLKKAAKGSLKNILACEERPLVSVDYNGNPHSSVIDTSLTMVLGDRMGKVFSWYDNEVGFSCRMVDLAIYMASKGF